MNINRREFIKLAGLSTIAGAGSVLALDKLGNIQLEASQVMEKPGALKGKRWGLVIDVRKIKTDEDYQKIINSCHSIHNVPDFGNPKDEVKWIWTEKFEHTFPGMEHQFMPEWIERTPFFALCNHCTNPPCVRACPTKATFKRPDGIIMQDMHRCIGCRFCMAACPFGARSFNWRDPRGKDENGRPFIKEENKEYPMRTKGVVEKCTLCYERLAVGKIPACAEASNGAIAFGDLEDPKSGIVKILRSNYTIRRKTELGTGPGVYYVIGGEENA